MTEPTASVIVAVIGGAAAIVAALIAKYDLLLLLKRTKFNLSGAWHGMSVYMPVDIYNVGSECVYKFTAELKQFAGRVRFTETIADFFDIDMTRIDNHPPRIIEGKGRVLSDKDVIIQFTEKNSMTCGTMYLTVNTWGKELQGIISVRNPYFGTPAGVKIILRRAGERAVTAEDLGVRRVKAMADAFLREKAQEKEQP